MPSEVTIKLLENAMRAAVQSKSGSDSGWVDGKGRFLIDGFPRKMDQAISFEEDVRSQPSWLFFFRVHAHISLMDHALFSGVLVVLGAVFHDERGDYAEAPADTRRD